MSLYQFYPNQQKLNHFFNLDCIGIKGGGNISFVGETSDSSTLNQLLEKMAFNQKEGIVKDPSDIETISSWKLLSNSDESSKEKIYICCIYHYC